MVPQHRNSMVHLGPHRSHQTQIKIVSFILHCLHLPPQTLATVEKLVKWEAWQFTFFIIKSDPEVTTTLTYATPTAPKSGCVRAIYHGEWNRSVMSQKRTFSLVRHKSAHNQQSWDTHTVTDCLSDQANDDSHNSPSVLQIETDRNSLQFSGSFNINSKLSAILAGIDWNALRTGHEKPLSAWRHTLLWWEQYGPAVAKHKHNQCCIESSLVDTF